MPQYKLAPYDPETKIEYNYEMWFKGEIRVLPEVRLVRSEFNHSKWCMSCAEFRRLMETYFTEIEEYFDGREWVNVKEWLDKERQPSR